MNSPPGALTVECAGELLLLCPDRAAYWTARRTLLVADVHLGKAGVFGRAGLAVPGGIAATDLARLGRLVTELRAERVMVLGDLMHAAPSRASRWTDDLSDWLDRYAGVGMEVVAGNHDRRGARRRIDPRIVWHDEAVIDPPFVLAHEPAPHPSGYVLGGHVHPTVRLDVGADRIRSPVFWLRKHCGVLPAFGAFTGGFDVRRRAGERLFIVGPDAVLAVPEPA